MQTIPYKKLITANLWTVMKHYYLLTVTVRTCKTKYNLLV